MSILSSLKTFTEKTAVGKAVKSGLDALTTTLANPVKIVTKGYQEAKKTTFERTPQRTAIDIGVNVATAAAAITGAGSVASVGLKGVVQKATTTLLSGGAKKATSKVLGTTIATTALTTNPELPSVVIDKAVDWTQAVTKVTTGEYTPKQAAEEIITITKGSDKTLTGAAVLTGAALFGGLIPVVKDYFSGGDIISPSSPAPPLTQNTPSSLPTQAEIPSVMATETLKTGTTSKKKRKRAKVALQSAIRITNKNYINNNNFIRR